MLALDARLGAPVDTYADGSQSWMRDDGPGGLPLEWRMHPTPGFAPGQGTRHQELFTTVAAALGRGDEPPAAPTAVWEGLQVSPTYGDTVDAQTLTEAVTTTLGIAPLAAGLIDQDAIGAEWERSRGRASIIGALLAQLAG